ncbi:MAG: TIGR00341 family protein [Magnetococcales bacterium]|nr:TIGR00341 family protein [Magnetococcales bacterium]
MKSSTAMWSAAPITNNYLLFTVLSTLVASVGLLKNDVAVVIGAMVIAPLLGPNLAFALGAAMGDSRLMQRSAWTGIIGILISGCMGVLIGKFWPADGLTSQELMARTSVDLHGMVIALSSGVAAVLSLTTGLSSTLVGVMVAVALLPPTVTIGIMLGASQWEHAFGATLLLMVNVVCLNLAALIVFTVQGVQPRTWLEKRAARQSRVLHFFVWFGLLGLLMAVILLSGEAHPLHVVIGVFGV